MLGRLLQGLFAALVVIALIAVPALALRPGPATDTPQAPAAEEPAQAQDEDDEDGAGECHGIQRAYWAVTSNPGQGEGKAEAAGELVNRAAELGCELSDAPAEGWRGGPPPWAGQDDDEGTEAEGEGRGGPPWATEGDGPPWGPPPWAGQDDDEENDGEGRGGPPWATEGDGPPWGMAWGYWLKHGGEDACERIAARLEAHPDAVVPEDLRQRITDELGCQLP